MTDIPIIFSAPMVLALLAGRKTMTRRLASSPLRRAKPGDRLWGRENLAQRVAITLLGTPAKNGVREALYAADKAEVVDPNGFNFCPWWKGAGGLPSIHMPRWASRLTLVVTATKIERLQDITEEDCIAEGVAQQFSGGYGVRVEAGYLHSGLSARETFTSLWCDLHGPNGWNENPELVALTFTVHKQNIDELKSAA